LPCKKGWSKPTDSACIPLQDYQRDGLLEVCGEGRRHNAKGRLARVSSGLPFPSMALSATMCFLLNEHKK
jgi:hypothetical protein